MNYYELLDISNQASFGEIRAAYRKLVKRHHPDLLRDKDTATREAATRYIAQINEAYAVLKDKRRRLAYDEQLTRIKARDRAPDQYPAKDAAMNRQRREWLDKQIAILKAELQELLKRLNLIENAFNQIEKFETALKVRMLLTFLSLQLVSFLILVLLGIAGLFPPETTIVLWSRVRILIPVDSAIFVHELFVILLLAQTPGIKQFKPTMGHPIFRVVLQSLTVWFGLGLLASPMPFWLGAIGGLAFVVWPYVGHVLICWLSWQAFISGTLTDQAELTYLMTAIYRVRDQLNEYVAEREDINESANSISIWPTIGRAATAQ